MGERYRQVYPHLQNHIASKGYGTLVIAQIAERIIDGETYKPDVLDSVGTTLTEKAATLRPSILSKTAVIQLRRAQDAIGSGQTDIARRRDCRSYSGREPRPVGARVPLVEGGRRTDRRAGRVVVSDACPRGSAGH